MTGRPVAKLCRTCCARFHPISQPTCDQCGSNRAAVNNTKKRGRPKPPENFQRVGDLPDKPTPLDLAAQLAALPEPSLEDLAAYLAEPCE